MTTASTNAGQSGDGPYTPDSTSSPSAKPAGEQFSAAPHVPEAETRSHWEAALNPLTWTPTNKTYWEGEKLVADVTKARREGWNARFVLAIQGFALFASTITVGAAIYGLIHASTLQRQQADDARMADGLKLVADKDIDAHSAGIAILARLAGDSVRRHLMLGVLVRQALSPEPEYATQVRHLLLQYADPELLKELIVQNETLSDALTRADTLNGVFELVVEKGRGELRPRDSVVAHIRQQLRANIDLMLATMKRLHVIRGLDFTGVWFAPPILRARWPNEELSAPPRLLTQDRTLVPGNDLHRYDQGWDGLARQMIFLDESDYTVITGIQFDGVQFHNAHLGPVMFVADTFSKVSFDSANLAQARFDRSVFDDGTTFESFVLEFEGARSFDRIAGSVYFGNCEFSIRRLMPRPLRRTGSFDDAIARDDTGHVIDALRGPGWTADHVAVRIEDSSASHFQRSAELLSGVLNRSDSDVRLGLESFGGQRLALVYGGSIRSDIDVARRLAEQVVKTSRAYHP